MATYFRLQPEDEDPRALLEPENQKTEPWGAPEEGSPCDKCRGSGRTLYRCESCRKASPDRGCEFCHGRYEFDDVCPACKGTGKIADTERDGVSVFPAADALYRYMLRRDADVDGCTLLELEGDETGDIDFDADEGVMLIRPTRIVRSEPIDEERMRALEREIATEA